MERFMMTPNLNYEILREDARMLIDIQNIICSTLKDSATFSGLRFTEAKDDIIIQGYSDSWFPDLEVKMKKDYSDINDAMWRFVRGWRSLSKESQCV